MELWQDKAIEIGQHIAKAFKKHPELFPLHTAFINFSNKHNLSKASQTIQLEKTIQQQKEEIQALELRIKRLVSGGL